MKCSVGFDRARLRCAIGAKPGEYDAQPTIGEVSISGMPLTVSPDRAAVAATLCFSPFIAGSLSMDRGCSPLVGSAIRDWFAPADLHVLSVDFSPAARVDGDAVVHVVAGGERLTPSGLANPDSSDVLFQVVPEGTGCIATPQYLGLASNAWLLTDPDGSPFDRVLPIVGVAVLFAEDLFASAIAVPGIDRSQEEARWAKLERLLDASGLGLVAEADAAT